MVESRVAPHPVVRIVLDEEAGTVKVNGALIDHDGSQALHQVAVHTVARSVAAQLGRPVRAVAVDTTGSSRLVIAPDGTVSNVEPIEEPRRRQEPSPLAPAAVRPQVNRAENRTAASLKPAPPISAGEWSPPRGKPRPKLSAQRPAKTTTVGTRVAASGRLRWPVLTLAALAVGTSAWMVVANANNSTAPATTPTAVAPMKSQDSSPELPAPRTLVPVSQSILEGVGFAPLALADVRAVPTPSVVTLRVTVTRPVRLVATVKAPGVNPRVQRVRVQPGVRQLRFTDLPAGRAQWVVRVGQEPPVRGPVVVAEPTPPPAPAPVIPFTPSTPTPVAPVPAAPAAPAPPPAAAPAPPPPKSPDGGEPPPKPRGTGGKGSPVPRDPDAPGGGGPIPG